MADYIVPILLAAVGLMALGKGEDAYGHMVAGAGSGLKLMGSIAPALVVLMTGIRMLRASGALDLLGDLLAPLLSVLGIPVEVVMLMLIRPFSGSAALAVGTELIGTYGPDSLVGRTAAVMLGSTETTFYTISVYFGACGIEKTRYAVPAALIADAVGFLASAWTVRLLY